MNFLPKDPVPPVTRIDFPSNIGELIECLNVGMLECLKRGNVGMFETGECWNVGKWEPAVLWAGGVECSADGLEDVAKFDAFGVKRRNDVVHGVKLDKDFKPVATFGCLLERDLDFMGEVVFGFSPVGFSVVRTNGRGGFAELISDDLC